MSPPPQDERRRFEQLCLYRDLYARRGWQDGRAVITVPDMIRQAEAMLGAMSLQASGSGSAAR